jgi:chorismate mutase
MNDITRRLPKLASQRSIPAEVRAAIGKLGADPHGNNTPRQNVRLPDGRVMAHIANTTIGNIRDARNLFQILPDMDYARQILISATISPGDLTDSKVLYSISDDSLDSNLTGPLLRSAQEFFDDSYRIRTLLHPMLNDIMFETGSYPLLIMPESSIDRIINANNYSGTSMESAIQMLDGHINGETNGSGVYNSWGVLGPGTVGTAAKRTAGSVDGYTGVSFEALKVDAAYDHEVKAEGFKVSFESFVPDVDENRDLRVKLTEFSKVANTSMESLGNTVMVSDNLNILKRPMVIDTRRKLAVRRIYGGRLHSTASLESKAGAGDLDAKRSLAAVEKSMYTKRRYQHIPVQPIMTHAQTNMDTYGHPLVLHLPSESVIPIHVPGNPAEHIGYYVMLDIDGNPISVADQMSYLDDIRSQMNNVDSQASQLIQQARRGFEGMGGINNEIIDELSKIYSETVEADLLSRLRSGAMSGNYELGKTQNVNRLMFARHMKGQKTMMLYVPAELMTYAAFDYNEYGVGKSVLEDGKILGAIRAAIMLSNTLATINNAVGGKTINIELDPDDENPAETVEFMLSEYAKVNSQGFSRMIGSTHPLGLADQIQNHGVNVAVSGNTRYPDTKFEVSQRQGVNTPIDAEFETTMRNRHIQQFGLSPEMMEGLNQTDFATTVVQNNLMLLKRVIQNQEKFEPFLTDFVRRYMLNSGIFMDEMRAVIRENKKYLPDYITADKTLSEEEHVDQFMFDFINCIDVTLPSPEVGDIKKSMDSYDAYTEALDKCLDAYLNEEMFATDTTIGMEELIPNIKAVVKAEFQRRWLRKYNIMSELDVFNTVEEEEGAPAFVLLDSVGDHLDGINGSIATYTKKVIKAANKRAKVLQSIADEKAKLQALKDEVGGMGGGDDLDSAVGSDDLGGGTDEGSLDGGDDLSLDTPDEPSLDDTPPEEGVEEEEAPEEEEVPEEEEETLEDPDANPEDEELDLGDLTPPKV